MNDDKMVDISVKNLARVHQRNRELQTRLNEIELENANLKSENFQLKTNAIRRDLNKPFVKQPDIVIEGI